MKKIAYGKQLAITLDPAVETAVDRWRNDQIVPPSKSASMAAFVKAGLMAVAPEYLDKEGEN